MDDVGDALAGRHLVRKCDARLCTPDAYPFACPDRRRREQPLTKCRARQMLGRYADKAGLARGQGVGSQGRKLRRSFVHSLRHRRFIRQIHAAYLPIALVQRQVGHRTPGAAMAYCQPPDGAPGEACEGASRAAPAARTWS
jgi:hypothetical protein